MFIWFQWMFLNKLFPAVSQTFFSLQKFWQSFLVYPILWPIQVCSMGLRLFIKLKMSLTNNLCCKKKWLIFVLKQSLQLGMRESALFKVNYRPWISQLKVIWSSFQSQSTNPFNTGPLPIVRILYLDKSKILQSLSCHNYIFR